MNLKLTFNCDPCDGLIIKMLSPSMIDPMVDSTKKITFFPAFAPSHDWNANGILMTTGKAATIAANKILLKVDVNISPKTPKFLEIHGTRLI